jgi:hypothetical protein
MTRVNAGEMPPKDEPRPTAAEIAKAVGWIANQIKEGEAARMRRRGPVTLYRLSREEYAHTVYDLLGVHYDVTMPGAFSEDPRWHGFERRAIASLHWPADPIMRRCPCLDKFYCVPWDTSIQVALIS